MSDTAKYGNRYTVADAGRAVALHEAGWTVTQIASILKGEGLDVHPTTVRRWVDADYADRQRRFTRQSHARKSAERSSGRLHNPFASPNFVLSRIQGLAAAGIPLRVLPAVMRFDFPDLDLSVDQVRYALETGRLPAADRSAAA